MHSLPKPNIDSATVFQDCIRKIKNPDLKHRLIESIELIKNAAQEFDDSLSSGSYWRIIREDIVNGNLKAKELANVYKNGMVWKESDGRKYYDKIISSAIGGICPICCQREAGTIDHFLPKFKYPRLSVCPFNLVPCCSICNDFKGTFYPEKSEEEIIHPYYEDIENSIWLFAKVIETSPPTVEYYTDPTSAMQADRKLRIKNYFELYKLGRLYAIQAAREMANIENRLDYIDKKAGRNHVQKHLEQEAISRRKCRKNSWESALYTALSRNEWYCDGGFKF